MHSILAGFIIIISTHADILQFDTGQTIYDHAIRFSKFKYFVKMMIWHFAK